MRRNPRHSHSVHDCHTYAVTRPHRTSASLPLSDFVCHAHALMTGRHGAQLILMKYGARPCRPDHRVVGATQEKLGRMDDVGGAGGAELGGTLMSFSDLVEGLAAPYWSWTLAYSFHEGRLQCAATRLRSKPRCRRSRKAGTGNEWGAFASVPTPLPARVRPSM